MEENESFDTVRNALVTLTQFLDEESMSSFHLQKYEGLYHYGLNLGATWSVSAGVRETLMFCLLDVQRDIIRLREEKENQAKEEAWQKRVEKVKAKLEEEDK